MAEKKWTEEQELVIHTSGRDLLVSAAAGSGKTAVLVERILQKILSKDHPVDVDRLLVVTFTKAAAGEMKERIREAIEEAIALDPKNLHLRRQRTLISHAKITTIDSFCSYIIRNHFDEIGLDPSFRVADQTETTLLGQEVMDQVFASHYEEKDGQKDRDFLDLIRFYGTRNTDQKVRDLVFSLYNHAQSFPWPKDWLLSLNKPYEDQTREAITGENWFQRYFHEMKEVIHWAVLSTRDLVEAFQDQEAYQSTLKTIRSDQESLEDLDREADPESFFWKLSGLEFKRLNPPSKKFEYSKEEYGSLKNVRDQYKAAVKKIQDNLSTDPFSDLVGIFSYLNPLVHKLVDLTIEYQEAFLEAKQKAHLMDFSDMEHYALEILVNQDGSPKSAAYEFQKQFEEVMIDEYQDSNEVQELLLYSISRASTGRNNYFMVGDVKQSIYRFRQARPEIFMAKYKSFSDDLSESQVRIDLTKNFRSRREVLTITNDVFQRIMSEEVGGVSYQGKALLHYGAEWYPEDPEDSFRPEILIGKEESFPRKNPDIQDKIEFEALMIAGRILELLQNGKVTDTRSGGFRPVRPGDIAILTRKSGPFQQKVLEVLKSYAIPARLMAETNYLDTSEVNVLLSFLNLIDNPLQDIPMASVLHSAMFRVGDDKLAEVREKYSELPFSEAVLNYAEDMAEEGKEEGKEDEIEDPILRFYLMLQKYRKEAERTPLFDLIQHILDETGFLNYVYSLPEGEKRRANLEKIVDLAVNFEAGSGHNVFSFMQYIRKLKKYSLNPSAKDSGNGADHVTIMTIHLSKGLEFPVVILAAAGDSIYKKETSETILMHPEEGMAISYIHGDYRRRKTYLYREALTSFIQTESMGEELRVLYVAMTRAKEKLIITGMAAAKDPALPGQRDISPFEVLNAKSYMDWIRMALSIEPDKYPIREIKAEDLVLQNADDVLRQGSDREALMDLFSKAAPEIEKSIQERMVYLYPKDEREGLKQIYSVSELKHRAMEEKTDLKESEEEPGQPADFLRGNTDRDDGTASKKEKEIEAGSEAARNDPEAKKGEPDDLDEPENCWEFFGTKSKIPNAALRGTAMHRFLEVYDFTREMPGNQEELARERDRMLSEGFLNNEEAELLNLSQLLSFLGSDLSRRMHEAALLGKLHRETPFVLGVDPDDLDRPADLLRRVSLEEISPSNQPKEGQKGNALAETRDPDRLVMVQGAVDAWFVEGDEIVIVDYKTDRVKNGEELLNRYRRQIEWYALALSKTSHKRIREVCLYSLYLQVELAFRL